MILVDSSIWVDYLRGVENPGTRTLAELLGTTRIAIGDLILTEVLQRTNTVREFREVHDLLGALRTVEIGGASIAVEAARNSQRLRALGITVRKTIDTLIATRCIESGLELLHNDRGFDAFERHLGLRCVIPGR